MAELPLTQGINRFKQNEDRFDRFANGTATSVWLSSDGQSVPSLRKFLKDKDVEINVAANGILALSAAEAAKSKGAADAAVVLKDAVDAVAVAVEELRRLTALHEDGAKQAERDARELVANIGGPFATQEQGETADEAKRAIEELTTDVNNIFPTKVDISGSPNLGGYSSKTYALGNSSGRTIVLNPLLGNFQTLVNNGNGTITIPASGTYSMVIYISPGTAPGAITASGFDLVIGEYTRTKKCFLFVTSVNSTKTASFAEASA